MVGRFGYHLHTTLPAHIGLGFAARYTHADHHYAAAADALYTVRPLLPHTLHGLHTLPRVTHTTLRCVWTHTPARARACSNSHAASALVNTLPHPVYATRLLVDLRVVGLFSTLRTPHDSPFPTHYLSYTHVVTRIHTYVRFGTHRFLTHALTQELLRTRAFFTAPHTPHDTPRTVCALYGRTYACAAPHLPHTTPGGFHPPEPFAVPCHFPVLGYYTVCSSFTGLTTLPNSPSGLQTRPIGLLPYPQLEPVLVRLPPGWIRWIPHLVVDFPLHPPAPPPFTPTTPTRHTRQRHLPAPHLLPWWTLL